MVLARPHVLLAIKHGDFAKKHCRVTEAACAEAACADWRG